MKQDTALQNAFDAVLHQLETQQVVMLHPDSVYRSLIVAKLLQSTAVKTFYYALSQDDVDLRSFIYGITHDLTPQHATFGRHLNTLPESLFDDLNSNFDLLLEYFARELQEMSTDGDSFVFIFDEYDQSDLADDVQRFMERLIIQLPPRCRILFNGRTLPRLSWLSLIARNRAAMLLNDRLITNDFYGFKNNMEGNLEVYALGPGFVLVNNNYIDAWEGHLPRLLFFFALDRPVITRSDICNSFWPELNPEQAVNVFHVTKRRLHKALEADVLLHNDGYYSINPDLNIFYDAEHFVTLLMQGRDLNNAQRTEAYQQAITLYRGPFLQGHHDRWILERQGDFRAGYIEALQHIAGMWEARNHPEQALRVLSKVLTEDLRVEQVNRDIMRLYASVGRRNEAAAHFQRVAADMAQDNRTPSPEMQQLYQDIIA